MGVLFSHIKSALHILGGSVTRGVKFIDIFLSGHSLKHHRPACKNESGNENQCYVAWQTVILFILYGSVTVPSVRQHPPPPWGEEDAEGAGAFVGHLSFFWKTCNCPTVGPGGSYINQKQHVFANRNEWEKKLKQLYQSLASVVHVAVNWESLVLTCEKAILENQL